MKEGEGIGQKTYIYDPWTWLMGWGLLEGVCALEGGGQRGKKERQL